MTKALNDGHCGVQICRPIILILAYKGKYDIPLVLLLAVHGDHFYFDLFIIFEMLLIVMSPVYRMYIQLFCFILS